MEGDEVAELPRWDIEQFIRQAGADRVSEGATEKLVEILEDEAKEIIYRAKIYALYAKRKVIRPEDIELAQF
ncbi:MAG: histone [Candidatus Micrarchaeota archaeon]